MDGAPLERREEGTDAPPERREVGSFGCISGGDAPQERNAQI